MSESFNPDHIYNEFYYRHDCGQPYERSPEWLNFFGSIAEKIVKRINPASILDAGCAMGFLVESLRDRGADAYGVDVSEYAIQMARQDIKPYCFVGSLLNPLPRRYDLVVCIEVLEHLQPDTAEIAIKHLCEASDDILFSSTPFDYYEATHFNVQPPEYWAQLFALNGFVRDVDFDASFITPWAFRFRKTNSTFHEMVRNYERKFSFLWKENQDVRKLAVDVRDRMAFLENSLEVSRRNLSEKEDELLYIRKELYAKEHALESIYVSRVWHVAQSLLNLRQVLLPSGGLREKIVRKLFQAAKLIWKVFRAVIATPGKLVKNTIRGIRHIRYNGVTSLFKRTEKELRRVFPQKALGPSMQKNVMDMPLSLGKIQSLLLFPLPVFSVPYSGKRVNLILDTLNEETVISEVVDALSFSALLAEKWQCELRIITRLDVAKKSVVSTILKRIEITAPNIEFAFIQAGNPKMSFPVGAEEYFVVTSWRTVKSLQANFDLNRVIYFLQKDERTEDISQEDNLIYTDILMNFPVRFILNTKTLYDQFVEGGLMNIRDHAIQIERSEIVDHLKSEIQQAVNQFEK